MTKYMLNILVYHFLLVVSDHGASAQEHNLRTRREQELDSFTSIDGSSIDNGRDPEVFSANIDAALLDKEGPLTKSQTCQTYSMSFYNSNYNTPEIEAIVPYAGTSPYRAQQWGRHALQWKGKSSCSRTSNWSLNNHYFCNLRNTFLHLYLCARLHL